VSHAAVFTHAFAVPSSAIDEYGHVNNVMYVQWMQDAAIRHVRSITEFKDAENRGWFAREHRIEYLLPAFEGEQIEVRTWVAEVKRVRIIRRYEFRRKPDDTLIARGSTQWIYVELSSGRPLPIPAEVLSLFPVMADSPDAAAAS
jgi:acyl-CoA thioester hydrolase